MSLFPLMKLGLSLLLNFILLHGFGAIYSIIYVFYETVSSVRKVNGTWKGFPGKRGGSLGPLKYQDFPCQNPSHVTF